MSLRSRAPLLALPFVLLSPLASHAAEPLTVTSSRFANDGEIPTLYTCQGSNITPPLQWSLGPPKTKSYAVVVVDPDVVEPAHHGFTHWILFDIPPGVHALKENLRRAADMPRGAREGVNDQRRPGYVAPCPPSGEHHYEFKVLALDTTLEELAGPTRVELEEAMKGHVIAEGELVGVFRRR